MKVRIRRYTDESSMQEETVVTDVLKEGNDFYLVILDDGPTWYPKSYCEVVTGEGD